MSVYTRCHVCEMDINTEYKDVYLEECGHSVCERCHMQTSNIGRCENCRSIFMRDFFEKNASAVLKEAIKERSLQYQLDVFLVKFHRVEL
jgi:hypothetical protein